MTKFVVGLTDAAAGDPLLAGSKGASLARLAKSGFAVPQGFVVTTATYRQVAAKLAEELGHLGDSASTSDNALEAASEHMRRLIMAASFPPGAAKAIRTAWKAMGCPPVSVRSSATAEDLAEASFAGQYESHLHLTSANDLLTKIKSVWASLHAAHAIGYRRRHDLSHLEAHMAVVVQIQLWPDAAGVMFTQDPVSGKNHIVVSAALGLGEGVVAGTAPADRFVLSRRTGKLLKSEIATKKAQIANAPHGGVEAVPVDAAAQGKPSLNQAHLRQLALAGRKLATLYGAPQDVEFAVVGSRIHMLQTRPMTATKVAAKPGVPWRRHLDLKHTWHRRGGPYFLLEQDATVARLRHMKDCYRETGSSMTTHHIGHIANGYLYVRANEVGPRTLKKRHKLQTERVDASLKKGKSYFEDALRGIIEDRLGHLRQMRAAAKTLAAKVNYMQACIETMAYVQGNLHWRQGKPGGMNNWHQEFSEITGAPEHEANVYVQAIQNRMTRLIKRIRELAKIAQSDPVLKRIFNTRDFARLASPEIASRKKTRLFQKRFKAMMRIYGTRSGHGYGAATGLATPTWNMAPHIPCEFIATYVEQDLVKLERQEKRARIQRLQATRTMQRQLAGDAEKLERFNRALSEAKIWVRFLEDHNYYMEQCTVGTMRESIDAVGQQLVDRGQLDMADDVFHFSIDELHLIGRQDQRRDLRPQVSSRAALMERQQRLQAPSYLGKKPPVSDKDKPPEAAAGLEGDIIRGKSASSGRASGRAIVAQSGQRRPQIHPGDILVANNVGPDWTPVFAVIGGLVLDSGSLSQHAAIVAREYRIPAVMQTQEASKIIRDGQRLTVDGDRGVVQLHSTAH